MFRSKPSRNLFKLNTSTLNIFCNFENIKRIWSNKYWEFREKQTVFSIYNNSF